MIWEKITKFPVGVFKNKKITFENKLFLSEFGLPEWVAPHIRFGNFNGVFLPKLKGWSWRPKKVKYKNEKAYVLGSAPYWGDVVEEGSPICIQDGESKIFIQRTNKNIEYLNKNMFSLAECLSAYAEMIEEVLRKSGNRAFVEKRIPLESIVKVRTKIKNVDPKALEAGSFWALWLEQEVSQVKRRKRLKQIEK